MIKAD
jgi:hypothetical protein